MRNEKGKAVNIKDSFKELENKEEQRSRKKNGKQPEEKVKSKKSFAVFKHKMRAVSAYVSDDGNGPEEKKKAMIPEEQQWQKQSSQEDKGG